MNEVYEEFIRQRTDGRKMDGRTGGRVVSETLIVVLRLMRIFVFLASAAIVGCPSFCHNLKCRGY